MSTNETARVMNQVATGATPAETPLHHAELKAMARFHADDAAGVWLNERSLTGQLVLRLKGDLAAASTAVEAVLGIKLPERLQFTGDPTRYDARSLAWISPDQWRLCCPVDEAYELEVQLRNALTPVNGLSHAVVNNTGGFSVIDIAGPNALDVLKKSTGYDVRSDRFPVGKAVGTTFAKTTVTLLRTSDDTWQLWVRRSFADYLWLWLQNASIEYGLRILED